MTNWVQILTVGTNLSLLILAAKIIRHLTILEFKVNLMWDAYQRIGNQERRRKVES